MASIAFQFDEHLPDAVAQALRRHGISVATPKELGLRGTADPIVLSRALEASRVIVTRDADFLSLHANGYEHAGIVSVGAQIKSIGALVETLLTIHGVFTAEEMAGTIEYA